MLFVPVFACAQSADTWLLLRNGQRIEGSLRLLQAEDAAAAYVLHEPTATRYTLGEIHAFRGADAHYRVALQSGWRDGREEYRSVLLRRIAAGRLDVYARPGRVTPAGRGPYEYVAESGDAPVPVTYATLLDLAGHYEPSRRALRHSRRLVHLRDGLLVGGLALGFYGLIRSRLWKRITGAKVYNPGATRGAFNGEWHWAVPAGVGVTLSAGLPHWRRKAALRRAVDSYNASFK